MKPALHWTFGSREIRQAVEGWWSGDDAGATLLRDNPRRRILRLHARGGDWLVKHYRLASGRHPHRERLKGWIGQSPAEREARALRLLHRRAVPVPAPLALARSVEGDRLLVLPYLQGRSLAAAVAEPAPLRWRLLRDVGAALRALHRAGFVHGDLHRENLWITPEGPMLLDLQRARRRRGRRARERDLGALDYSLWDRISCGDRLRLRRAALGLEGRLDAAGRRRLRAVGRAARRRAARHGRSRTRRALRPGRAQARLELGEDRGLRCRDVPTVQIREALRRHREALAAGSKAVLKADARSRITRVEVAGRALVVKEVLPRGALRMLADRLRGSPGRRAWRGGHGLRARGIGAARPLAFGERRGAFWVRSSWVVLERVLPGDDALARAAQAPEVVLDALLALLQRLHLRNAVHGDLKASHVLFDASGAPRLVDLENVRFPRHLGQRRRLAALAQLNASLPDSVPAAERLARFRCYAAHHPFSMGWSRALRRLVRDSLARRHRWTGQGCACATRRLRRG